MSMTRLFAIVLKELRQLRRDRLTRGMILGIPTLQLLLFGFAINLDIRHIDAAIVDQARTATSREIVASLEATGLLNLRELLPAEAQATLELATPNLEDVFVAATRAARQRKIAAEAAA